MSDSPIPFEPGSPILFVESPGNENIETESENGQLYEDVTINNQDNPASTEPGPDPEATPPLLQQESETFTQPQETYSATTVNQNNEDVNRHRVDYPEPPSKMAKLSTSIDDEGETCPICLDSWSNSGDHRLVALKCGHLFGNRCVERWLKAQQAKDRTCPTCKTKAALKDLRFIYARKLITADTTEISALQKQLDIITTEKGRVESELRNVMATHRACIRELDSLRSVLKLHGVRKTWRFSMERNVEMKDGACRVLAYNCRTYDLVASQKSTNSLFPGFGVRRISCVDQRLGNFTHLHPKPIRDLCYSQPRDLLMSVSLDGVAKFLNKDSIALTVNVGKPLWSCSFDPNRSECFYIGSTNGQAYQYDIRNTGSVLGRADSQTDRSPVISVHGTDFGPVTCQLNSAWMWLGSEWQAKSLPIEPGSFTSLSYDRESQRLLLNCRPNGTERAKMLVMKLLRHGDEASCYTEHVFYSSSKSSVMSRSCWVRGPQALWAAGHSESDGALFLHGLDDTADQRLSASEPILDLCPMQLGDDVVLAAVSDARLRFYKGVGGKS